MPVMLVALVFFHPSGQQGIISTGSLQDTTPKMPQNCLISNTLARKWQSRGLSLLWRTGLRSSIRSHYIISPPKWSLFLHGAFYTTRSCGGVVMSSSMMRRTWRRKTLTMAMVLVNVTFRIRRTRGGPTANRSTTRLWRKKEEDYHSVELSSAPPCVVLNTNLLVARETS
jgi:hypothetical protein